MVTDSREGAGEEALGRHDAGRRRQALHVRVEAVGRFAERGGPQVGAAHQRFEVDVDAERFAAGDAALTQQAIGLGPFALRAADAGAARVVVERLEPGHQPDFFVAARDDGQRVGQQPHALVHARQLGGQGAILSLEPVAARYVD